MEIGEGRRYRREGKRGGRVRLKGRGIKMLGSEIEAGGLK